MEKAFYVCVYIINIYICVYICMYVCAINIIYSFVNIKL